ncbi:uncharacterized protein LOC111271762 isoform X3 [Varroa jacobsoni]|uniref:uncharacterized protein LOC111271762 isoform X3 n=1 Tax=Varroa jacobsoni TaxID=62625 RepID=UPI000BF35AEC|nr:uncharacterized protein LOC111271762 isoform X3 [Varroa jacobsoni]
MPHANINDNRMLFLQWRQRRCSMTTVSSWSQPQLCRRSLLLALIAVVVISFIGKAESRPQNVVQHSTERPAITVSKASTATPTAFSIVQPTSFTAKPAITTAQPDDRNQVDRRLHSNEFHPDEYRHAEYFVTSRRQTQPFQNERSVVKPDDVVYQRTMIRNPEDAFTATIQTDFQCPRGRPGYYADVQNGCRVFHICHQYTMPNGEPHSIRYSQLCPPDADVERARSLNPSSYRAYKPERYMTDVPAAPVTTRTTTTIPRTNIAKSVAPATYSPPPSLAPRAPAVRSYEKTRYISRPAIIYNIQGGGRRIRYDTHMATHDGGHSDIYVERNLVEPLTTTYVRPASVREKLVAESPRHTQNAITRPSSHSRRHYYIHQSETPKVNTDTAQVQFSTYAPHMGFLGFIPDQRYTTISLASYPYNHNYTSSGTLRSFDSRYKYNPVLNAPVHSPKEVPRFETLAPGRIRPLGYVSEHDPSYERSYKFSLPTQRPLIPASEFPGFRQSAKGVFRSSLTSQRHDPHAYHHSHHQHHHNNLYEPGQRVTSAPLPPTTFSQQRSLPAVPAVPVTTEKRPASPKTEEIVDEVLIDKARRPVAFTLQQYDSRHNRHFERRVRLPEETIEFVQEPVTVRGGTRVKTLFSTTADEVPYLKRTARSYKEFVGPIFKGASAIPGVIPQEYLE